MSNLNELRPIQALSPFKRFCCTIGNLPSSYVESMTYMELVYWLCDYLKNTVIPAVNNNAYAVQELQNFVTNYFENLDVQDEIDNKLDEMVESGELQEIIEQFLNSNSLLCFNTVNDMKNSENLINGCFVTTFGFYEKNDGGGALYKIRNINNNDVVDNMFIIPLLDNSLIAELIINNELSILKIGAKGDGVSDDTLIIQNAIDKGAQKFTIIIPEKEFAISQLKLKSYTKIKGLNWRTSILKGLTSTNMLILNEDGVLKFNIDNLSLDGNYVASKGIYFNNSSHQQADTFGVIENLSVRRMNSHGVELGSYIREMRITNAELYGNKGNGLHLDGCSDSIFNFITSRSNDGIGFYVNASDNRFVSCKAYINGTDNSPKVGFDVSGYRNIFVGCSSQQNTSHGVYLHDASNIIFDSYMGDSNGYLLSGVAPSTPSKAGLKMFNCNSIIINGFFGDFLNSIIGQVQKYGVRVESSYNYDIDIVCKSQVENYSEASLYDYAQRSVKVNGTYYQQSQLNNISNDLLFIRKIISSNRETLSFRNENQGYDISLFNNDNTLKIDTYSGSNGNLTYQSTPFKISGDKVVTGSTTSQIAFYGGGTVAKQTLTSNATDLESAISLVNDIKSKLIALNLFN